MEAIRIARAAYPNRLAHGEIITRYGFCLFDESLAKPGGSATEEKIRNTKGEMKRKAEMLMQALNLDVSTYQIGKTKVFFRRVALEELEASRGRVVDRKLTKLQASARRMIYRKRFLAMKLAAVAVQAQGRACNGRRAFLLLRFRLIRVQCLVRMMVARKRMYYLKFGVAATKIQTRARLNIYRSRYIKLRFAAAICQREGRRAVAMRRYPRLKKEALEDAKMVNIVKALQERLAEEMRSREEAETKLAKTEEELEAVEEELEEAVLGGSSGPRPSDEVGSPLRISRGRSSSVVSEDGGGSERVQQLEAQVRELEATLERKSDELEVAHSQLEEKGQSLSDAQIEMAAMAAAVSGGADAGVASNVAGTVAAQKEVVANAVAAARSELRLRVDALEAELATVRVARVQASTRLNELERSESTRTKRLERELRSVRGELEVVTAAREAADVSLRDEHVRSLESQIAIEKAEAASAKVAANRAGEDLARQQKEMLDVTAKQQDTGALLEQFAALRRQMAGQAAELERLRADSLESATMLADANKQVRLARMGGGGVDDASAIGEEEDAQAAADKLELTEQLSAARAACEQAAAAAEAANARVARNSEAESLRSGQLSAQIQSQQTEVELLRQDQAELGQKLAVAVAEAAAACAAAGGGASVQEAVQAAKVAVESASDTRIGQLEQQIHAKDAELQSAVARYEHSEQELAELSAAKAGQDHGLGADKGRFEALEKEVGLQTSQLEARQAEVDGLRKELADQGMELTIAQAEKDVAAAQNVSVSAGEQAAKAMADLMTDTRVKDLEKQLEAKQTQLDELHAKCVALREQISAAGQQDAHRLQLEAHNRKQQEELSKMRLEFVEMGKNVAASAATAAAATAATGDPSAVLEIVKQAGEAASSAAQEKVGGYKTQIDELQTQLASKVEEVAALEKATKKTADEAMSAKLGAKIGDERQKAQTTRVKDLEKQLQMTEAETRRLQEKEAGVAGVGEGAVGDAGELGQQLGYARAELDAERKAHAMVRENLEKANKSSQDMQLLNHSPVRGGGKKAEDELRRIEASKDALEQKLEASQKKELGADRKQAEMMNVAQTMEKQLETSKNRVRVLIGDTMSMTQEVSKLEDSLGMSTRGAKQSSKDLPRRVSTHSNHNLVSWDFSDRLVVFSAEKPDSQAPECGFAREIDRRNRAAAAAPADEASGRGR